MLIIMNTLGVTLGFAIMVYVPRSLEQSDINSDSYLGVISLVGCYRSIKFNNIGGFGFVHLQETQPEACRRTASNTDAVNDEPPEYDDVVTDVEGSDSLPYIFPLRLNKY